MNPPTPVHCLKKKKTEDENQLLTTLIQIIYFDCNCAVLKNFVLKKEHRTKFLIFFSVSEKVFQLISITICRLKQ